jgi:hypothetical protein
LWTGPPKDFISLSICAGPRSSAASGRSFARSHWQDGDLHGVGPLDRPPGIAPCGRWRLRANPIALAIPCHRVVRTDGDLAGYRWGIERKVELIRKEAIV